MLNDLEAAVAAQDFLMQARIMLTEMGKGLEKDSEILRETAEVLELAYRAEKKKTGMPDVRGMKSSFPVKEKYKDYPDVWVVTEVCRFPDGGSSPPQRLLVAKTSGGWRVPVSDDASFGTTPSYHFDPAERTLTVKVRDNGAINTVVAQRAASCNLSEFKVTAVEPGFGLDDGGETITLVGTGFTNVSKVTLDGLTCGTLKVSNETKLTCKTPAHAPGWASVSITKTDGMMATRDYGYRYTGDQIVNIGWCNLQWPPELTVKSGSASANLYGQVWSKKITEPAGAPSGLTAQVGFGPQGTDPRSKAGWKWFDATWNVQVGNNDEFVGTVTPTTVGTYSTAFRFSDDSGVNYMVCDYSPGTSDGFSTDKLGKLIVAAKASKTDDPGEPTVCGGGDQGGCTSTGGASPTFLGLLLFLATIGWVTTRREQ